MDHLVLRRRGITVSPALYRVWEMIAQGKANKVIAIDLGKSDATVSVQVRALLRRVGCTNRVQLALAWHGIEFDKGKGKS